MVISDKAFAIQADDKVVGKFFIGAKWFNAKDIPDYAKGCKVALFEDEGSAFKALEYCKSLNLFEELQVVSVLSNVIVVETVQPTQIQN